jgi:hypothetical protein
MQRRDQVLAALVIGLLVGAGATYAVAESQSRTRASTTTVTLASTATNLMTTTITSAAGNASVQLHEVTFNESGECGAYASNWAVTLTTLLPVSSDHPPFDTPYAVIGNVTITQPSNATLPLNTAGGSAGGAYKMISKIVFTVPDGVYEYDVTSFWDFSPPGGMVYVNGSDVVVQLVGPEMSGPCY